MTEESRGCHALRRAGAPATQANGQRASSMQKLPSCTMKKRVVSSSTARSVVYTAHTPATETQWASSARTIPTRHASPDAIQGDSNAKSLAATGTARSTLHLCVAHCKLSSIDAMAATALVFVNRTMRLSSTRSPLWSICLVQSRHSSSSKARPRLRRPGRAS